MIGADRIKDRILSDARENCRKILDDARREAESIIENANKEAFKKVTVLTEKARAEALNVKQVIRGAGELEGRKSALKARQDIVDEAFEAALKKVSDLPEDQYREFLEKIFLDAAQEGEGQIVFNRKDRERLGEPFVSLMNGKLKSLGKNAAVSLARDELDSLGGFVLRYGDMEINCTLEVMLDMSRPGLEFEVANILFN